MSFCFGNTAHISPRGSTHKNFKGKKNADLWRRYLKVHPKFKINYHWVKGHAGHPENERADQLAFNVADGENLLVDEVFEMEREAAKKNDGLL